MRRPLALVSAGVAVALLASLPAARTSVPAARTSVPAAQASLPAAQTSVPAAQPGGPAAQEGGETPAERFLRLSREGSPVVRPQAARRLATLGDEATAAVLDASGGEVVGLARLGADAVEVLGELPGDELRALVWRALADPDFPWRPAAARSLARTARPSEEARLAALLDDPIAPVRAAGVLALRTLDATGHDDALAALLADPDDRVRREAAALLADRGDPCKLAWPLEDLRRTDRFFDYATGDAARFEALRLLAERLGGDHGFAPARPPDDPANREALAALEAELRARCGGPLPELPPVARAGGPVEGEALGLEVRSCRRGEVFLRWTRDDRLLVGLGRPEEVALPPGTVAGLAALADEALGALGEERAWGEPGCDAEVVHWRPAGAERTEVLRVAKGPDAVEDLRPAPLDRLVAALVASVPDPALRARVEATLAAVGGPPDDDRGAPR